MNFILFMEENNIIESKLYYFILHLQNKILTGNMYISFLDFLNEQKSGFHVSCFGWTELQKIYMRRIVALLFLKCPCRVVSFT